MGGVEREREDIVFVQLGGIALALYGRSALAGDAGLAGAGLAYSEGGFGGFTLGRNVRARAEVDALLNEASRFGGRT